VRLADVADALDRAGLLVERRGALPESVTAITDDSRRVRPGALFVAVRGSARDGHAFLADAAAKGAVAALVESPEATTLPALVVREGRRATAVAAAAAYGEPATRLTLVAVTGTNGKSTTVSMLRHLLDRPESPCASIGTIGVLLGSAGEPLPGGAGLTTPGPVELQRVRGRWRWRSPRTRSTSGAWRASRSTPPCSRTSRATTWTTTGRWTPTSPPRRAWWSTSARAARRW
jgi:UDP-N-acetylmuramoyl-L-alanyl-D-glutamate--2,6-diaminopimelate ligase